MKAHFRKTEYYTSYNATTPVELDSEKFPDFKGATEEEFLEYIFDNLDEWVDGDDSPLSIFIYELIKPENIEYYNIMLDGIKTEDDYKKYEWIICDLNMLLFTNPVLYLNNIISFISHKVIGRKFNFFSAIWVNSCYYDCNEIDINDVDKSYLSILKLYKSF